MFAWFPTSLCLVHRPLMSVNPNILDTASFTVPRHCLLLLPLLLCALFLQPKSSGQLHYSTLIIENVMAKTPLEVISRNTLIPDLN